MSRLRIVLNKREKALSSKEKRPHSEIVKDTVKPSNVSRMPFTAFCFRKKRRIKTGAITMARGIKVTVLVKMKRANPIKNHTVGMYLSFIMLELLVYTRLLVGIYKFGSKWSSDTFGKNQIMGNTQGPVFLDFSIRLESLIRLKNRSGEPFFLMDPFLISSLS